MDNQQKLNDEIEAAYAHHKRMLPKKDTKKKYTKVEHLSHVMAWAMMILTVGSLVLSALISAGAFSQ